MTDNVFLLDSNILVYAYDASEKSKHNIAKELLKKCFLGNVNYAISLQNISEFIVTVTKKIPNPISITEAKKIISSFVNFDGLIKIEPTKSSILNALDLCTKYNIGYWDALIASVMLENNIFYIYTENTKDFSRIKEINVVNPFTET